MDDFDYLLPKKMLQLYRECPDEWLQAQAKEFRDLPPDEQAELLSYIAIDHSRMVQYLHRFVIPAVAREADTPAPPAVRH